MSLFNVPAPYSLFQKQTLARLLTISYTSIIRMPPFFSMIPWGILCTWLCSFLWMTIRLRNRVLYFRNKKSMLLTFTRKQHGFFLFYFVFLEHVMPAPVLSAPLPGLSRSYQYLRSSYTARTDPLPGSDHSEVDRTVQYGYWYHEDPFHMDRLLRHRS